MYMFLGYNVKSTRSYYISQIMTQIVQVTEPSEFFVDHLTYTSLRTGQEEKYALPRETCAMLRKHEYDRGCKLALKVR